MQYIQIYEGSQYSTLESDIYGFVEEAELTSVINSSELTKGQCDSVVRRLKLYLINKGYSKNNVYRIDLYNPKFDLTKAHPEWTKFKPEHLVHTVLYVDGYYIDLTGSQYSPDMGGVKIYTQSDISKLWSNYKIMEKDSDDKYIGGDYSSAPLLYF